MERGVVCEVTPTNLLIDEKSVLFEHRAYRGISVITPLSIRRGAGGEAERASSSFENMPFLHAEDALLEARRASSTTLFVIAWFVDCYECDKRIWYVLILRELSSMRCNDYFGVWRHYRFFSCEMLINRVGTFLILLLVVFIKDNLTPCSPLQSERKWGWGYLYRDRPTTKSILDTILYQLNKPLFAQSRTLSSCADCSLLEYQLA